MACMVKSRAYNRSRRLGTSFAALAMNEGAVLSKHTKLFAGRRLIVVALVIVAVFLFVQLVRPAGPAAAQVATAAATGKMIAVAGQIAPDSYGLYLFDSETGIMALYQWVGSSQKLRLLAARNCTFDLQLDDYKTDPPPSEIRRIVREAGGLGGGQQTPAAP